MATPSSGLRRNYNCSALLPGGKFLLCGTDVGDMVVYGCVETDALLIEGLSKSAMAYLVFLLLRCR